MGCNFLLPEKVDVPRRKPIPLKNNCERWQKEVESSEDEFLVVTYISSREEGGLDDNIIVSPQTGEDVDIPVYKEIVDVSEVPEDSVDEEGITEITNTDTSSSDSEPEIRRSGRSADLLF